MEAAAAAAHAAPTKSEGSARQERDKQMDEVMRARDVLRTVHAALAKWRGWLQGAGGVPTTGQRS